MYIYKNIILDIFYSYVFLLNVIISIEKAPDNCDLLKLISGICDRWYIIGVCLGIKSGDLNCLYNSNQDDVVKLFKVLQMWMEKITKPVTWNTILEVIGRPPIENKSVVIDIEKFLECEYLYNIPSNAR